MRVLRYLDFYLADYQFLFNSAFKLNCCDVVQRVIILYFLVVNAIRAR